jgi:hypothetical protein
VRRQHMERSRRVELYGVVDLRGWHLREQRSVGDRGPCLYGLRRFDL